MIRAIGYHCHTCDRIVWSWLTVRRPRYATTYQCSACGTDLPFHAAVITGSPLCPYRWTATPGTELYASGEGGA